MDQPREYPLHSMSLPLLAEYCAWELALYQHSEAYKDQHCVELFRRVTILRDAAAWQVARQCFTDIIYHWLRTHPDREALCQLNSEEYYVAAAYARFWQATTIERRLVIPSLAIGLHYLRISLNCAVLEALRSAAKPAISVLEQVTQSPSQTRSETEALWEKMQHLLSDEHDRRLAYLLYYCGLKPREIVQLYPQVFGDVQEIYRLRCRIVARLQDML
ncbi:MAG: hypothetical protein JO123_05400 [Ktedonobacteraceae bacterium]|nr:hypothetical protein [Ktedonobacteraceae bacterium]